MMVLSSLSPLFVLWAVRGIPSIDDVHLLLACFLLIVFPNAVLYLRIKIAREQGDIVPLVIGQTDDHREHLLVYLFAMLMPLYDLNFGDRRAFLAALIATAFIVFLFHNMGMYYMNFVFALLGYKVYTVYPSRDDDSGRFSRADKFVLLSSRPYFENNQEIMAVRISNSVYFEPRPSR